MTLKEKILEAALRVFLTKGYAPASMNDIAVAANTSKGGIYHHFKNKENLFCSVMIMLYSKLNQFLERKVKNLTELYDILEYFFTSSKEIIDYLNQLAGSKDIAEYNYHILMLEAFKHLPNSAADIDNFHNNYTNAISELFKEAQAKGIIRKDLDPNTLALESHALIEGLFLVNVTDKTSDVDEKGEKIFKEYWKKITTQEECL